MTSVLEANVRGGTGTRARLPEQVAAGKTGTAQEFTNAWFVGYTPHLATAVWMGNPDEEIEMRNVDRGALGVGNVFGGSLPAMIWGQFNTAYHDGLEALPFAAPDGTREGVRIRTDQEEDDYLEVVDSFCGVDNDEAAIDTDEDGIVDYCDPEATEFEFDEGIADCPLLFEEVDEDEDGEIDGCSPPTTTTTTTTTTTVPGASTTTTTVAAPSKTPPTTATPPTTTMTVP